MPFTKASLHALLTNVLYLGKLRHKDEVYEGEHERIIDPEVWRRVQILLSRNGKAGGSAAKNKFGALLKGLLRWTPCDCSMVASHTTRPGGKRYRYYTCSKAQKRGWKSCPSPSVPAGEIERFVVEQIRAIGRAPNLLGETIDRARAQTKERMAVLDAERTALTRELAKKHADVARLVQDASTAAAEAHATARLADLQEQIRSAENRLVEISQEHAGLGKELLDRRSVEQALAAFDPVANGQLTHWPLFGDFYLLALSIGRGLRGAEILKSEFNSVAERRLPSIDFDARGVCSPLTKLLFQFIAEIAIGTSVRHRDERFPVGSDQKSEQAIIGM